MNHPTCSLCLFNDSGIIPFTVTMIRWQRKIKPGMLFSEIYYRIKFHLTSANPEGSKLYLGNHSQRREEMEWEPAKCHFFLKRFLAKILEHTFYYSKEILLNLNNILARGMKFSKCFCICWHSNIHVQFTLDLSVWKCNLVPTEISDLWL